MAHPVDGGADIRLVGSVPAADQGPGEERAVVGAFIKLAMIHLMLNRLKPKHVDAEFKCHNVA